MQSKAATVDAYIAEAPEARREALGQLRDLCRETLPGVEESMSYGMLTYRRGEDVVTAFASQKAYIAFYAGEAVIRRHSAALAGLDCGNGCIRYRRPSSLDFGVVRSILGDIAARRQPMC